MKIEKSTINPNFGISVDKKFIKNAENFYMSRNLPSQYKAFRSKLEQMEYWGEKGSVLIHTANKEYENGTHLLCLKNKLLNKKQAIVIAKTEKFNGILRFFLKLNDYSIQEYEKLLTE